MLQTNVIENKKSREEVTRVYGFLETRQSIKHPTLHDIYRFEIFLEQTL
jgi:hypothetical protein